MISSRHEFQKYRDPKSAQSSSSSGKGTKRSRHRESRTAYSLVAEFLQLLRGQRSKIIFALITVTVSTLVALVPPAGSKFVVEHVIGEAALPAWVPSWVPQERWPLLVTIATAVLLITFFQRWVHVWGRWQATKATKLFQMRLRKQVFEHMVRLPLYRVQELKSGGSASVLRRDVNSVGELVFGMFYDPWRSVVHLLGSLLVLIWIDWRLLFGAFALAPVVYFMNQAWIKRIRPAHRIARALRQRIDATTTESFGGIRVVRAFGRQRDETNRVMRANHVMARHEIDVWWRSRVLEIVWETLIPLCGALLMLYGGWHVMRGTLSLGDLVMFLAYLMFLLSPISTLAQSAAKFQKRLGRT